MVFWSPEKVTLPVVVESLQKPPPIAPKMSLANEESPPPPPELVVVGVALGVAAESLPDAVAGAVLAGEPLLLELVVGMVEDPPPSEDPPPRKEKAGSERRESPRREREAEPAGSLAGGFVDCPDWKLDCPD